MARRKSQPKKRGKSVPKKPPVKLAGKGKPQTTYTAFVNAKGQRVKAGSRGAKPIQVRINRPALQAAAKKHARIGGKFATYRKAKRSAQSKRSANKSALTRKAKKLGAELESDFFTPDAHVHYRYYDVDISQLGNPDTFRAAIEREQLQGAITFHVKIGGRDKDGNLIDRMSPMFLANPENADDIVDAIGDVLGQYEFQSVVAIQIRFRYARE